MASNDKHIRIILKLQDEASKGMNKAANNVSKLSDKMNRAGKTMTAAFTLPLAGVAVAGVKMASDLDASMRNIQSVGRQTEEELKGLSQTFLEMSTDMSVTTDSAQNLADAFYDIQGSGFEGADAMKVLEAATKAATAGLTETAVASEGITAVLNSYGKSADEAALVSDLMFTTVDRGVGSFEELTSSMSNVVGTASAAGISFEEVSAAVATMSKQGMSFSEATVSMNQALLAFIKPSKEMEATIKSLGHESGLAMIEQLGFAGAMEEIADATGGSVDEMAKLFGSVRGLRAATALTGEGAAMFAEDLAAMGEAAGKTDEAFEIQMESFRANFENFKRVLERFAITVGNALLPSLTAIMKIITPLFQAFSNLPPGIQTVIVAFGVFVAAAGPLLMIGSKLIGVFTMVGPAIQAAAMAFTMFNPLILAVVATLGVVAFTIVQIIQHWEEIKNVVGAFGEVLSTVWNRIKEGMSHWGPVLKKIGELILKGLVELFKGMAIELYTFGKLLVEGLAKGIYEGGKWVVNGIGDVVSDGVNAAKDLLGIASPSRVTYAIGQSMGAGLAEGFQQSGAMQSIVSNVARGAQAMSGMARSAGRSAGKAAGATIRTGRKSAPKLANTMNNFASAGNMNGGFGGMGGGFGGMGGFNNMTPQAATPGAGAGLYINGDLNINVPPGTTEEQVNIIAKELGRRAQQRGAFGLK